MCATLREVEERGLVVGDRIRDADDATVLRIHGHDVLVRVPHEDALARRGTPHPAPASSTHADHLVRVFDRKAVVALRVSRQRIGCVGAPLVDDAARFLR